MTITENNTGTASHAVGRVAVLYDNAKAISPDGMERLLSVESPIFANDRIVTENNGRVSIVIDDEAHTQIDLGAMSNVIIDEDIFGGTSPEVVTEAAAQVEQIQESFLVEGVDLSVLLTAPATDGGHPVSDFDRVTHEGNVSNASADNVNVIFDQSDYADMNSGNAHGDPLDNLIDVDASTS